MLAIGHCIRIVVCIGSEHADKRNTQPLDTMKTIDHHENQLRAVIHQYGSLYSCTIFDLMNGKEIDDNTLKTFEEAVEWANESLNSFGGEESSFDSESRLERQQMGIHY